MPAVVLRKYSGGDPFILIMKKLFFAAVFSLLVSSGEFQLYSADTMTRAVAQGKRWLIGMEKEGLQLEYVAEEGEEGFQGEVVNANSCIYFLQKSPWYVTVSFKTPLQPEMTLPEIEAAFQYIALDRLPTPGLEAKGWNFRPQVKSASISKGVTFLAYDKGILKLKVQTECYALFARIPQAPELTDAKAPRDSFFQLHHEYPLQVIMEAPFQLKSE